MPSVSWIVSFSLLVISFLGIVFASMFFAKPVDNYKVSFMRMFPFEMPKTAENNGKFYSFSTYLFAGMCFSPIIVIVEESSKLSSINPLSILIACILGLAALCFVFLNIFDVTHVKPHLVLFAIFALLTLLSSALVAVRGFIAFDVFRKHSSTEPLFMVSAIFEAVIVVFLLCLIVNPKLRFWAKLDLVDGEYVRPKRFPLAYSEWGILLALFLTEASYFVQLLIK